MGCPTGIRLNVYTSPFNWDPESGGRGRRERIFNSKPLWRRSIPLSANGRYAFRGMNFLQCVSSANIVAGGRRWGWLALVFRVAYLGSCEQLSFSLVSRWPSVAPDGHHSAGGGHWWHWWHRHRPPPPPITLISIPDSELQEFAVFLPRRRTGTTSLKNTCSPPNGPTSTQPGILRPFSVDINKPAAFHTQTLLSERRPRPRPADNLTPFSLSRVGQSGSYLWLPLPNCQVGKFHKLVFDYADRLSALHSTQCAAGAPLIRWTSLPALWLTEQ